jgi:hypothetical protein
MGAGERSSYQPQPNSEYLTDGPREAVVER